MAKDAQLSEYGKRNLLYTLNGWIVQYVNYISIKLLKYNGKIKIFTDKQKLTEFITGRPILQEILKGDLQAEMKGCKIVP